MVARNTLVSLCHAERERSISGDNARGLSFALGMAEQGAENGTMAVRDVEMSL